MIKIYYEGNAKAFLFFSQNMTKKYHCYFLVVMIVWIIMEFKESVYFRGYGLAQMAGKKHRQEEKQTIRKRLIGSTNLS
ncbi:TPA: hypothetical protein ROX88_001101 [Bacillus pseudomycoides]|nr:hypothetical protein [Bacillus pseudomycoides]